MSSLPQPCSPCWKEEEMGNVGMLSGISELWE